jgi:N-acetylneuraminic acid mutarotase
MFALIASLAFSTAALAQMPINPWKKAAPFPYPDEELYGVALNGKMYVIGGWDEGKAAGLNYEYNPATDKWTEKKGMPRLAHHAALASANGKVYVIGGFRSKGHPDPTGGAWEPIAETWEYDPAADSWKSLAPLPPNGAAVAVEVGGKIYVIGGATTVAVQGPTTFFGPSLVLTTNEVFDPATNKGEPRGCRWRAITRTPPRLMERSTSSAAALATPLSCPLPTRMWWRMPRAIRGVLRNGCRRLARGGGHRRSQDLHSGWRGDYMKELSEHSEPSSVQPATNSWISLPPMPMLRHGIAGVVIGNEFHLVSGMIQSAGALSFRPRSIHTGQHDVLS